MTLHASTRAHVMFASMLGLALTAAAAHAESQGHAAGTADKGSKQVQTSRPQPPAAKGADTHSAKKTDTSESDMIMLQEPFRPSRGTQIDYKGIR